MHASIGPFLLRTPRAETAQTPRREAGHLRGEEG